MILFVKLLIGQVLCLETERVHLLSGAASEFLPLHFPQGHPLFSRLIRREYFLVQRID